LIIENDVVETETEQTVEEVEPEVVEERLIKITAMEFIFPYV
jgi:hypothetical protein